MAGTDYVAVRVTGLEDLESMFKAIGPVGARAALQKTLRKASQPVADEAARLAPRGKGFALGGKFRRHLYETIYVTTRLSRSQQRRRGASQGAEVYVVSSDPKAHLLEYGHLLVKATRGAERARKNSGKNGRIKGVGTIRPIISRRVIGHVPAYPFMRPAFDAKRDEVFSLFLTSIDGEVQRVARRYARQIVSGKASRGAGLAYRSDVAL